VGIRYRLLDITGVRSHCLISIRSPHTARFLSAHVLPLAHLESPLPLVAVLAAEPDAVGMSSCKFIRVALSHRFLLLLYKRS
jgi:hypothetical protein